MNAYIETNPIEGFRVYGLQMVDYTVDGAEGKGYLDAVLSSSMVEAAAFEKEAAAYSDVIRARKRKIEVMGDALSVLTSVLQTFTRKNPESDDLSESNAALPVLRDKLKEFGFNLSVNGDNKIRRDEAMYKRNDIQTAIDMEDNDLQQDMIALQGLMSKRDSAYNTATKLMKKVTEVGGLLIRNMGN